MTCFTEAPFVIGLYCSADSRRGRNYSHYKDKIHGAEVLTVSWVYNVCISHTYTKKGQKNMDISE